MAEATAIQKSRVERAQRAPGSGLVCSSTSDTRAALTKDLALSGRLANATRIDPHEARVKRMRRSVLNSARLLGAFDSAPRKGLRFRWFMVTLTLRDDAEIAPRDVSDFVKCVREWLRRAAPHWIQAKQFAYTWVLELTKRARPHYHVLFRLPRWLQLPKADRRGWWKLGLTQTAVVKHAFGYIAKYVSKGGADHAADLPKGFRMFGVGGLSTEAAREVRWWNAPKWAQEAFGFLADIRPDSKRGGRCDRGSGAWLPSPWLVVFVGGQTLIYPRDQTT